MTPTPVFLYFKVPERKKDCAEYRKAISKVRKALDAVVRQAHPFQEYPWFISGLNKLPAPLDEVKINVKDKSIVIKFFPFTKELDTQVPLYCIICADRHRRDAPKETRSQFRRLTRYVFKGPFEFNVLEAN